jgi:hypothetical protein
MDGNDYMQWLNGYWDDIVTDYNEKHGTEYDDPEVEEKNAAQWEDFLDEEYQAYCDAWEERKRGEFENDRHDEQSIAKFEDLVYEEDR